MSTQNPVLDSADVQREVVLETLAKPLQDFADESDTSLTDPEAPRANDQAPFVVTSYPTQQTVKYPHIIVQESNFSGGRFDLTQSLWESDLVAIITIEARSTTERYDLQAGVVDFIVKNASDGTFRDAGYTDVEIQSTGEADWTDVGETTGWQMLVTGRAYHD